jgi:HAD superfamily hydrolase (TIGR01490 family)
VRKIAFFDFDGTITRKDTLLEVIKFQKGALSFYFGFFVNLPVLLAFKLKLVPNQFVKERILTCFFKGVDETIFQTRCDNFAEDVLPNFIRPAALIELDRLKTAGFEIVVVSASADSWIKQWCDKFGLQLIASKLKLVGGKITGLLDGENCNGAEKVRRIRERYDLTEFSEIYCYGDSAGDKEMLAIATKSFFKPFR